MRHRNSSFDSLRRRRAATLVEILVVVAIAAVVVGLGFCFLRAGTQFASDLDEQVQAAAAQVGPKSAARPSGFSNVQANGPGRRLAIPGGPFAASGISAQSGITAQFIPGALYAIDDSRLLTIDPVTAVATPVGTISIGGVALGMDFRAGKLHVMGEGPNSLYEIDSDTAATIGGPIAISGGGGWLEGDMAFRSDGLGFIARGLGTGLRSFDISAPVPTFTNIGPAPAMDGLAFNATGVLYGLKENGTQLYTIDMTTGAATNVGTGTGLPSGGAIGVGGLAFDSSGKLYGLISYGGSASDLVSIDPVTGVGTKIATIAGAAWVRAIRFAPVAGPPPPGPGPGNPPLRPPVRRPPMVRRVIDR